jgi:uncharacterized protein (TIGR00369 family)
MNRRMVTAKQQNSRTCFVCGLRNAGGLHAAFFELDNGELVSTFSMREEHDSYPGRVHGGVSSAILDETIGRAILIKSHGEVWGVTAEFTVRFRKLVPVGVPLRAVGRIIKEGSRVFEGTGELLLEDRTVAVEGRGKYIKMRIEEIGDIDPVHWEWKVVPSPDDPASFDFEP